ncbi:portal protein [Klebsiella pneumoniae]|uniref:portal protein n=1 Tax=Klebsiella pneumoniae TaxID=573 RepID=UPI003F89E1AE
MFTGVTTRMIALGTGKALQLEQIREANAIDKLVNPPMVAPTGLKNKLINLAPGGVTYVDEVDATKLNCVRLTPSALSLMTCSAALLMTAK